MPVYLFTYHAYGTWMPNHRDGFRQRDEGYQPSNPALANAYKNAAAFDSYQFDEATQRLRIDVSERVYVIVGSSMAAKRSVPRS